MEAKMQVRVASLLSMLLGIWIAISPLFISVSGGALTNIIIVGAALAILGFVQLFVHTSLPSWLNGLAGMWLFVSAFVFSVSTAMATNMILSAIAAVVLSLWDSNEVEQTYHPIRV